MIALQENPVKKADVMWSINIYLWHNKRINTFMWIMTQWSEVGKQVSPGRGIKN